jgi:hypothetical protein
MDFHIPDYVQVSIEGNDATPYVISYHRRDDLCEIGESFDLSLSDQYPWTLNPYNDIIIEELYGGSTGYVLRGYIIEIAQNFADSEIKIRGLDKSTLLNDYYIAQELKSNGQTVDYWINRIIQMTGLSVHFDAHSTQIVEVDIPLGYQTAADAVLKLERLAAYYAKYDSQNDYIKIFRLSSSQPVITISTSGSNKPIEVDRKLGTENTRNVVKIYGGYKYDPITHTATQVFDSARTEMPELLVDKTSVVMSSAVRSQTYAHIVANRILAVVNSLDDEQLYMLAGFYPTVHVGNGCYIDVGHANYDYKGNRMITSIETSVDPKGATTTIGVGKKCPRIAIQLADPPIFITTTKDGVGVSWDGGDNFVLSNTGLIGSDAKFAWSIAVNQYGQSMVLTANGLYRRYGTGGVWTKLPDLPDPPNSSYDFVPTTISGVTLAKVVEEPTRYNKFHILARKNLGITTSGWSNRTWVYSTSNFGYTWNCKQLYVTQGTNLFCPSGLSWSVYGSDIESSPVNNVYVLVNGGTNGPNARFVGVAGTYYPDNLKLGYQDPGELFTESTNKAKLFWEPNPNPIRHVGVYTSLYSRNYSWCLQLDLETHSNFYLHARVWKTVDNGENWYLLLNQKVMYPAVFFRAIDDPTGMPTYYLYANTYMITPPRELFFDYLGTLTGHGAKGAALWRLPVYSTEYDDTWNASEFMEMYHEGTPLTFTLKQRHYIGYIDIYENSLETEGPTRFVNRTYKDIPYLNPPNPPYVRTYTYPPFYPYKVQDSEEERYAIQTKYNNASWVSSHCIFPYAPSTFPWIHYHHERIGIVSDYDNINAYLTSDIKYFSPPICIPLTAEICDKTGHPLGDPPAGYSYNTRENPSVPTQLYNSAASSVAYADGVFYVKGKRGMVNTMMYCIPGQKLSVYPGFENDAIPFQMIAFDIGKGSS